MKRNVNKFASLALGVLSIIGCKKVDYGNTGNTTPTKPNTVTLTYDIKKFQMDVTTNSGPIPTSISMYDAPNNKIAQYDMRQGGGLKVNYLMYFDNPLPDSVTNSPNKTIFQMAAANSVTVTKTSRRTDVADSVFKYSAGAGSILEFNKGGVTNPQALNYFSQLTSIEAVRVQ